MVLRDVLHAVAERSTIVVFAEVKLDDPSAITTAHLNNRSSSRLVRVVIQCVMQGL
jgi:hypothetical protein